MLDPGRGRTKTGYFWAIARDDRPWGGSDPPGVVYTYAPGRSAAVGLKPLAGYSGIVQCDGYAVYRQRGAAAHRRALRHRGQDPRPQRCGTSRHPPGRKQAARRGA